MRASFFLFLFMVSIVASKTKFGAAETNPSDRLHAKDVNTARYLKTADAQDNLIGTKDEERNRLAGPFLRWARNSGGDASIDEAVLNKAKPFTSSRTKSVDATSAKARETSSYTTELAARGIMLYFGVQVVLTFILLYFIIEILIFMK